MRKESTYNCTCNRLVTVFNERFRKRRYKAFCLVRPISWIDEFRFEKSKKKKNDSS